MRKLVVTEFLSLDGVMEDPGGSENTTFGGWSFKYWNDELAGFKGEETDDTDALLLGRKTYQAFASAWTGSKMEGADFFNGVRKYVVSTTLDTVEWNNSVLIKGDFVEEINKLKAETGQDITVHGSCSLVQSLMKHDLVDRYRLLVYPVVLGAGKRLFGDGIDTKLNLISTQSFSQGVLGLIYEPDRSGK